MAFGNFEWMWVPATVFYYAIEDAQVVLLLLGGDKSSQSGDIIRAANDLRDWKERANAR